MNGIRGLHAPLAEAMEILYFRDPNGYVIELACKREGHGAAMGPARNGARDKLARWNTVRRAAADRS